MGVSKGVVSLQQGLGLMRKQGLYTDLTIRCNDGTEHKVHKAVVCSQSRFFHDACKPDSPIKAAQTGVIEFTEDDPLIVKAMVTFLYEGKYHYQPRMEGEEESDDESGDEPRTDEEESDDDIEGEDPMSRLMFNIQCYMLADKYEIKLMTQRALDRIRELLAHEAYHFCEGFPTVVHFIYANTVAATPGGRQLRDAVLAACEDNLPSLLLNPRFDATLGRAADFWRELARVKAKVPQSAARTWVKCPECDGCFPGLFSRDPDDYVNSFPCPFCPAFETHPYTWATSHALPAPADVEGPAVSPEERTKLVERAMRMTALDEPRTIVNPRKRRWFCG